MSNNPRTGLAVAGLSLGTALNPLNSSMIAVALVVLRADFGLDVATVTWVVTSFYLASAAGQPLMGRLADRFGPRRMFMLGMGTVAVTCALAPFSPNFALLCVARAVMAVGTAAAYPERGGDDRSHRPACRDRILRGRSAGSRWQTPPRRRSGPVAGGLLVGQVGWEALFLINVPLALAALFIVRKVPRRTGPRAGQLAQLVRDSDIPGIAGFVGSLLLVMMALLDVAPGYRWWMLGAGTVSPRCLSGASSASTRPSWI